MRVDLFTEINAHEINCSYLLPFRPRRSTRRVPRESRKVCTGVLELRKLEVPSDLAPLEVNQGK